MVNNEKRFLARIAVKCKLPTIRLVVPLLLWLCLVLYLTFLTVEPSPLDNFASLSLLPRQRKVLCYGETRKPCNKNLSELFKLDGQ